MRRPERAVYLILGAGLSELSGGLLENTNPSSAALGYPMIVALGLVAVIANVSSIQRLRSVAKFLRLRGNFSDRKRVEERGLEQKTEAARKSREPAGIQI